MRRRFFVRGLRAACAVTACIAIAFVAMLAFAYDGKCGGFFPGLSTRHACSFGQYVSGDMLAIAMVWVLAYWPMLVALLVLPPALGFLLDRRANRDAG